MAWPRLMGPALAAAMLVSCARQSDQNSGSAATSGARGDLEAPNPRALPPLPAAPVPGPGRVPGLAAPFPAPPARILALWDLPASPWATNWITGLESSTDLKHWRQVARVPYAEHIRIELTNGGRFEFYRAFTGFK